MVLKAGSDMTSESIRVDVLRAPFPVVVTAAKTSASSLASCGSPGDADAVVDTLSASTESVTATAQTPERSRTKPRPPKPMTFKPATGSSAWRPCSKAILKDSSNRLPWQILSLRDHLDQWRPLNGIRRLPWLFAVSFGKNSQTARAIDGLAIAFKLAQAVFA